jgi:hypothetical protein
MDWSRWQEGWFGQATADAKQEQSKADAGSPSNWYFPTAGRFRSSRTYGVGSSFHSNALMRFQVIAMATLQ